MISNLLNLVFRMAYLYQTGQLLGNKKHDGPSRISYNGPLFEEGEHG